MTSISINHDRHTSTHWELQDNGTIYESTNGDGETVSGVQAFRHMVESIVAGEKLPGFPIVTAENDNPPPATILDAIDELYQVAEDGEATILDKLRRRAGQTWDCYGDDPEQLNVCWTNGRPGHCERCGRPRPDGNSAGG